MTETKHPHDMTDNELRVAVAVEVMGWVNVGWYQLLPDYPSDMTAAWTVVEKLASYLQWDEHPFDLVKNYAILPRWTASFDDYKHVAQADSPARAICEAALLAVRAKG